jgi:plastocyanin
MQLFTFLFAVSLTALAVDASAGEVQIQTFAFTPKEITVTPGTKIVWTNHDETPHTIIASDKSFTSKAMDTNDQFEYTFASEGDYGYFCSLHPFMKGVVHVRKQ